jgi:uncharacterized membrane protein YfcA
MAEKTGRKGRKLNVKAIKQVIVCFMGALTAFGSALTGISAQVAFAPMLTWMLGFAEAKARATALLFSVVAAAGCVVVGLAGVYGRLGMHDAAAFAGQFILMALVLAIGGIVGVTLMSAALVVTGTADRLAARGPYRIFQSVGVIVGLFVLERTTHASAWEPAELARLNSGYWVFLIAMSAGAAARLLSLTSGLLLVPALYYLCAFPLASAVLMSLSVAVIAAIPPILRYYSEGEMDREYMRWLVVGAGIGGVAGGYVLVTAPARPLLLLFGVVTMFLCARELARTA